MEIPRIALLTWCTPESRYAGGAAIRKLLGCMPRDRLRWCGFHGGQSGSDLPEYAAFKPWRLHWRLNGSVWEHLAVDRLQARPLAERMWRWLQPFDPQVLWVVPEVWVVPVALALQRISGLPLHATVHDAPETAGFGGIPRGALPRYLRQFRRLMTQAQSLDAVSAPLIEHLRDRFGFPASRPGLVVPPCVGAEALAMATRGVWQDRPERRIGLCGSIRTSTGQWQRFLMALGRLPNPVEVVSFTPEADIPHTVLPPHVRLTFRPYAAQETELIAAMADAELDAAYLGVWREPERRLFGRTSLSSKLTAYAAAGLPVLVDAEADAVAATLVAQYGAGLRLDANPAVAAEAIQNMLTDADRWNACAGGARRLAAEAFDLDRHAGALRDQLCRLVP